MERLRESDIIKLQKEREPLRYCTARLRKIMGDEKMKGNCKVACGALAVTLVSGILALGCLIVVGMRDTEAVGFTGTQLTSAAVPLLILAGTMVISTLVMVFALPGKKK